MSFRPPDELFEVTRLPTGLTVATASMPHMTSISLGVWVGVGGRHEPASLNGASHFIEHMLFKGTRRRSSREISQAVEGIGGYLNAFTTEEHTCLYSKALHDRAPELLDVLLDMLVNSTFDPAEVDKERDVIREEIASYLDEPAQHVQEILNELMWPRHPLGRPLTGTLRALRRLGREELVGFLRENYTAPNTLICAAGRLTHSAVLKAVRSHISRLPAGKPVAWDPATIVQTAPAARLFTKKTAQTQIALGLRVCSRHDPRRHALRVLNTMLGENMSSRLFQVLREDSGLAYSITSSTSLLDDTGALVISAGLDTDKLPRALKLIMRELRRFVDRAPGAAEMRRTRDYLIGQLDLGLEGTENRMTWLGEHLLAYGCPGSPAEVKRRVAKVQASEVRAAARDFLRPSQMNLAVVSPLKKAARLVHLLTLD